MVVRHYAVCAQPPARQQSLTSRTSSFSERNGARKEVLVTLGDALRLRLSHEDLTVYNAVQKALYLGVILVGMFIVITGLCLWKPVQFSEAADLFGSFQIIRLIHFLCMSAIVAFIAVHVALALLVPRSLIAMITGGPVLDDSPVEAAARSGTSTQSNALAR
jgi:thiosulfate reductase cytochrome b subunit